MLGKGVGKGVQSGSDALAERQQGAYDAVYVPPGTRVEIHLTSQIDIDYDKKGRKVSHVQPTNHYSNNRGFD
jgi:ferric-dicitrate binding protein FerR (iron transport regulator)